MSHLPTEITNLTVSGLTSPEFDIKLIPTIKTEHNYNGLYVSSPPLNIFTINTVMDSKGNIVEIKNIK